MELKKNLELTDESVYPDDDVLKKVLGRLYEPYCELIGLFVGNELEYEWRYYRDARAWLCKVRKKKKTIIWMSAWEDCIKATIYFPEKYVDDLYRLELREDTKQRIKETKNTGKSKPCVFEIRDMDILGELEGVMKYKIGTK